jgi:Flp pilus assembly protein TadD
MTTTSPTPPRPVPPSVAIETRSAVEPPPQPAPAAPPKGGGGGSIRDAQRALETGDTTRAIELARQAATADPGNAETWLTLGAAYEAGGRPALARGAYRSCVARGHGERVDECRALLAQ